MTSSWTWLDEPGARAEREPLSPLAHGLHYGTGVFEGIRCYASREGPRIFRLDDHLARMARGAACLALEFDAGRVRQGIVRAARASGLADAYIRPISFYAAGGLGLDVAGLRARHGVAVLPWGGHLGVDAAARGIRVQTSALRRNTAASLPPLKLCGAYINSVLAKHQAARAGFDEALFVDDDGFVCEATGENVFCVRSGRVVAVEHPDALAGITCDTICALTDAPRRRVTLAELREADEIFVVGTSAEVTPVAALDRRTIAIGPVTREIAALYAAVVRGRAAVDRDWSEPIGSPS